MTPERRLAAESLLDEFADVILHGELMELHFERFEVGEGSVLAGNRCATPTSAI
ncbi:MAG: hypothetical protein IH941_12350 [Acidobacteria bacterium]|nr:hypothetical protein [Acidobacteriota bacterium]